MHQMQTLIQTISVHLYPAAAGVIAGGGAGLALGALIRRLPEKLHAHWRRSAAEYLQNAAGSASGGPLPMAAVAAVTAVLTGWLFYHDGLSPTLAARAGLLWALVALAAIDLRERLLPDVITLPLIWAGLLFNLHGGGVPVADAIHGAVAGYLFPWLLAQGYRLVRRVDGMGGGDFKLLAAAGAWLGVSALPKIVVVAVCVTLAGAAAAALAGRRARTVPFGPGIAAAMLAAMFGL